MEPCVLSHYWLIDAAPKRGSYHATCKNCGEEREFRANNTPHRIRMSRTAVTPPAAEEAPGLSAEAIVPMCPVDAMTPPADVPIPPVPAPSPLAEG